MKINYFFEKIKKETNLEKRFFIYACLTESILAFISIFLNLFLGFDYILAITCLFASISFIYLLYYEQKSNNFTMVVWLYSAFSTILLDIFYFISGGLDSSIQAIFLLFILTLSIVLDKRFISTVIIFFIINIFFLYGLEVNYPNLVIPYPNQITKDMDMLFGTIVTAIFMSILVIIFKYTYSKALENIKLQEDEIEHVQKRLNIERKNVIKANQAKSDFLSVMTHEIRTPLNAIVGIANLIEENNAVEDKALVTALKDSSDNLLALVSDILDFSKIQEGKIFLENIAFDLKKLVFSMENIYSVKSKEKNNKIIIAFDENIKNNLFGDPVRLTQIITNLVSNAMKFTQDGTITISVIKDTNFKDLKDTSKVKLTFYVIDTGVGISSENQEKIFEKFTQEDTSITRKYGGTGLGLSITKSLVELMGGMIQIKSEINKGSTFYFELIFKEIENKALNLEQISNIDLSKLKLLLVEDNDLNIMITTKFFNKWNLSYEVAKNGFEAIEKAQNSNFDIILMDLQMPELDGFSATKKIREFNSEVPIFALTANASLEIKEQCLSSGFNDYVTKPFKPDVLKEKIFSFISK